MSKKAGAIPFKNLFGIINPAKARKKDSEVTKVTKYFMEIAATTQAEILTVLMKQILKQMASTAPKLKKIETLLKNHGTDLNKIESSIKRQTNEMSLLTNDFEDVLLRFESVEQTLDTQNETLMKINQSNQNLALEILSMKELFLGQKSTSAKTANKPVINKIKPKTTATKSTRPPKNTKTIAKPKS